jgi:glutamine phosphoribosylpyrophosphate amidotransferase
MCAVLGLYNKKGADIEMFSSMLEQSMIRGKHATGISWVEDKQIKTYILPVDAKNFKLPDIRTNMIIGHCRYSTSDLKYNQPIHNTQISVVHNGVITQADPTTWEETYNYKFITKCDSEIIMRTWEDDKHPLNLKGSMATLVLDVRKKEALHFFRNEQRPLYYSHLNDAYYIASTKDILQRSGITSYKKTEPCVDYAIYNSKLNHTPIRESQEDLQ